MKTCLALVVLVAFCSVEAFNYNQLCDVATPNCPTGYSWTQWFNRDSPGGTGDWETFPHLRNQYPAICDNPVALDASTTTGASVASQNQVVHYTLANGFWCYNSENTGYCKNYRVRFCCKD